jgi:uncharacterized protein YggU (UPF0235/DUF167 family)
VRVSPRAKHNVVTGVTNGSLLVRTTAAPTDGKANQAVIRLLAKYLDVPPSTIKLLRGTAARNKVFVVRNGAIGL